MFLNKLCIYESNGLQSGATSISDGIFLVEFDKYKSETSRLVQVTPPTKKLLGMGTADFQFEDANLTNISKQFTQETWAKQFHLLFVQMMEFGEYSEAMHSCTHALLLLKAGCKAAQWHTEVKETKHCCYSNDF